MPGLAILICLWAIHFCSIAADFKIGLLAPQDTLVDNLRHGAALAVQHQNEKPGPKLELVLRGRPGQWGTEGDEAVALALDEGVAGVIAPPSGSASHQVMQVAGRTRIPVASLCSDSSVTRSGIPWVIRIAPRTDAEAECIFAGVTNSKALKWSALVPDGRAGREAASDLSVAATKMRCALNEPVRLPEDSRSWGQTTRNLLAPQPQGVLLWLPPTTAGVLAKALRQAGFQGTLAGPAWLHSPLFLTNAAQAAEGFLIPAMDVPQQASENAFSKDYAKEFGNSPDFAASMAYDAACLLAQIAKAAGDKPLYKSFPLQQEFQGASGPLRFDQQGNRELKLRLLVCRKGQFSASKACPAPAGATISP